MTVNVIFGKNGFYHPAYGRMGRGDKSRGLIYVLPDAFKAEGMLPSSAELVDPEDLEEVLEEIEQKKPIKPTVVDETQLAAITGAGKRAKVATAQAKTAPTKPRRAKAKAS